MPSQVTRFSTLLVAIGLATALTAQAPRVPSTASGEWPTYGGDLASTKYSPLDQITAANFATLKVAWRAKSPDGFLSLTLPDGTEWSADSKLIFDELNRLDPKRWRDGQPPFVQNYKATPLMVNGALYVNTASSVGAAYDARTGALKWVYNPQELRVRHDHPHCGGTSAASPIGPTARTSAFAGAPATAISWRSMPGPGGRWPALVITARST